MAQAAARSPAAKKTAQSRSTPAGAGARRRATAPRPWSHGQPYWNELRTRDAERAMRFYAETVGWTFEESGMPNGCSYWVAMMDGQPVAGLFPLPSQFADVPESWMSFFAVDDVDARVAGALKAGAKLAMPIFDVPDVGRIAMLVEPSGAGIGWITPVGPRAGRAAK